MKANFGNKMFEEERKHKKEVDQEGKKCKKVKLKGIGRIY
jgi:hypothetical protein